MAQELLFSQRDGYCRIKSFDLNTRDNGAKGIPELNPADGFLISSFAAGQEKHVLIDAGKKGQGDRIIIPYLLEQGIRRIDLLVLSHLHYDHFGGIIDVLNHSDIHVEHLVYAPISAYAMEHCDVGELNISLWNELAELLERSGQRATRMDERHVGDVVRVDESLCFEVLSVPDESHIIEGERVDLNNLNIVLKLHYRQFTALFPGDLGVVQTENMIRSGRHEKARDVFLLKAAHHGGADSSTPQFNALCNPKLVIVPCNFIVVERIPDFVANWHDFSRNGAKVFRGDVYREIEVFTDGRRVRCRGKTDHFEEQVAFGD